MRIKNLTLIIKHLIYLSLFKESNNFLSRLIPNCAKKLNGKPKTKNKNPKPSSLFVGSFVKTPPPITAKTIIAINRIK